MSQPSPRSKPSSPSQPHDSQSHPTRRLLTPEERFGAPQSAPPQLSLVEDSSADDEHTLDADDPFAPYVRPKAPTRQHSPRRHELKHHEVRPHELKRHEVKRLERERHEPIGHAARGPLPSNEAPVRKGDKKKRASRFLLSFVGTAFALFLVYCGVAALSAPQFAVKTVKLEGLKETPRDKVDVIARHLVGQNFFRANRTQVEKQVNALPTVASAQVVREAGWPPRLKVVVHERSPLLRVGQGNTWWVVDEKGVPYRMATASDANLYALTAPKLFNPELGKVLAPKWWERAAELEKALEADNAVASGTTVNTASGEQSEGTGTITAPFWQLRRLYLDQHGMASIRVSGRGALRQHNEMLIRLGESDWKQKLARARVALSYFERTGRDAQELDLVSYTYPTWRAKAEGSTQDTLPARFGMIHPEAGQPPLSARDARSG